MPFDRSQIAIQQSQPWRWMLVGLALLLAACGGSDKPRSSPTPASGWAIGAPDAKPTSTTITIPTSGSINYVTRSTGPLTGKTSITLRYRIDMAEGVRIFPPSMPEGPSIITLYFQRESDDWSGAGKYETYRWYATSASQMPITVGVHDMTISLESGSPNVDPTQLGASNWTAIQYSRSYLNGNFEAAKDRAGRIGFVLGGGTGYGHGVSATGPATLTIEEFTVQ